MCRLKNKEAKNELKQENVTKPRRNQINRVDGKTPEKDKNEKYSLYC